MSPHGARRLHSPDVGPVERRGADRIGDEVWESMTARPSPAGLPPTHVARPRLVRRIAPPGARLTCIVAGAGYGKTMLLREWEVAAAPAVARVDADESTDAAGAFWSAVARSVSRVHTTAAALIAVTAQRRPVDRRAISTLVDALGRSVPPPGLAVCVDDYHLLKDPQVHRSVRWFVEQLPPTVHLVLAGRGEPPLPLPRWRMAGWLAEIREPALEMTFGEARRALRAGTGRSAGTAEAERMIERAERWPAGIRLLAGAGADAGADPGRVAVANPNGANRSDADRGDGAGRPACDGDPSGDRAVADYVLGDVLERVPDPTRAFLLATSILETLTAESCRAITGRVDAGAVLDDLVRRSLFTRQVTSVPAVFRYQGLFRDVLRHELAATDRAAWTTAHRQAAAHFEAAGDTESALHHWFEAEEPERAFDLLVRARGDLAVSHESGSLRPWLERMPTAVLSADPRRTVAYAAAVAADGRVGNALSLLDRLPAAARDRDPALGADAGWLTATCLALLGDAEGAGHAVQAARRCQPAGVPHAPIAALWSEIPLSAALAGDWEMADAQWRWGREQGLDQGALPGCRAGLRAALDVQRGAVGAAAALLHGCLRVLDAAGMPAVPGVSHLLRAAAVEAAERGDLQEASRLAGHARRTCEAFDANTTPSIAAAATTAEIARRAGQPRHALAVITGAIDRAEEAGGLTPGLRSHLAEVEVRSACALADWDGASRAATHIVDPVARTLADARVRVQRGDTRRARTGIDGAGDLGALAVRTPARALDALVLLAATSETRTRADQALRDAVDLATDRGLVGSLVADVPAVDHLLAVGGQDAAPLLVPVVDRWRRGHVDPLPEPLSAREHQVLRLLPTELSNPELATELCLSLNTVKTHLKTIYRKLGVTGRSGAVHRARALDLLPPRSVA